MVLHEDRESFQQLITLASQEFGIEEIYVEKDYFVVLALKSLSESKYKQNGIFKGGTSLSKAYGIINRFSEDIDMAVVNDDGDKIGGRGRMKAVEKALTYSNCFKEDKEHERTNKQGARLRQAVYNYPLLNPEVDYGQASKHLFIDTSRMTVGIPFEEKEIRTYISDYLRETGQADVIDEFGLSPIQVLTLSMERTFVEKLGSIVKFSFKDDQEDEGNLTRLKKGIRHIYDLHMLLQQDQVRRFMLEGELFHGQSFNEFWKQVLEDDLRGNREKRGYAEYINSEFAGCILCRELEKTWNALRPTYESDFTRLLFKKSKLPSSGAIMETLTLLKQACQSFDEWKQDNKIKFELKD